MKVMRITHNKSNPVPIHEVGTFDLINRVVVIEPLEDFIKDFSNIDLSQLEVKDVISLEVIEMSKEEFEKLQPFRSPVL